MTHCTIEGTLSGLRRCLEDLLVGYLRTYRLIVMLFVFALSLWGYWMRGNVSGRDDGFVEIVLVNLFYARFKL